MDKCGGSGLNPPFIRQGTSISDDPTGRTDNKTDGKFKDKNVKSLPGSNEIGAAKPANVSHPSQNTKRLGQDYVISHEKTTLEHLSLESNQDNIADGVKSTGDLYFIDSVSKEKLISQLRDNPTSTTVCIRSTEDLEKHNLMQEVWLEDGILRKEEGRLFGDKPLTLIFDLTVMTPSDIASFNDMLQENPSCNNKLLGPEVKMVCLVNTDMLNGNQASNPDLWRRLRRMTPKEIPDTDQSNNVITDEALITQITKEVIPRDTQVVTVDFSLSDNWYHLLFGGISFDKKGGFIFCDGALAKLPDNAHIVFKNAPWKNSHFKEVLGATLREGSFEANHQRIKIPRNLTLYNKNISQKELGELKSDLVRDNRLFNSIKPVVCLNANTMASLKSHSRIEGVKVVEADLLTVLLEDCEQLAITGPLEEEHWLWLLTKLQQLPEHKQPAVFCDLPAVSLVPYRHGKWAVLNDSETFVKGLDPSEYIKYDVSPTDSLDSLSQVNLTSQNDLIFSLNDSPLLSCLKKGKLVILSGLEKNPKFAESLHTLLIRNPYLFINGHKIDLSEAQVAWIKSTGKYKFPSPIMDHVFSQCRDIVPPPVNPVYALLKKLPRTFKKDYPVSPPWDENLFEQQFNEQAQLESALDGSAKILPCHQRRAMHVLLAKAYRGDGNVYGFIKAKVAEYYPDEPRNNKAADISALRQWLQKHPNPTNQLLKTHFWALAQHCPVNVHKLIFNIDEIDESAVKKLAVYLLGAVSSGQKQTLLASKFKVSQRAINQKVYFNGTQRSTLRDVLVANRKFLKADMIISETVKSLEHDIAQVLKHTDSFEKKTEDIKRKLESCFRDEQLPQSYEDLPAAILTNQRHSYAQQERRLTHLAQRIEKHPIVFLQGEAGAGKTFMAQAVATRAGYARHQVIQLGPNETAETLFGGSKYITETKGGVTNSKTEFTAGPLLEWVLSNDPPLLVLDEANLANEGLLAPLAGLTQDPPVIYYRGCEYKLSKKHRIILTGNPDHYEGRHFDSTLKSCVPTFFYHPLAESVLANSIIKPGLPSQWSDTMKQQACDGLLALFNHFQKLVPGDLTTPRDLKDVLATVRQILSHHTTTDTLSEQQINALIHRAFMDSLGGAITVKHEQRLGSLNVWYEQQFPEDKTVLQGVDDAFDNFLQKLQKNNLDADFRPLPIEKLAYRYWQCLDKDNTGRIATVVEGPAGWGKDLVLKKVIKQWQGDQSQHRWAETPFVHINANANQWSGLVDKVKKAMRKGQVIAISELNLIPSHFLEGLFNDILTGDSKPGFRLFATINPGSFEGRESMSPALKSRCTQIKLGNLSQQEMIGLIERLTDIPKNLPKWLAAHFQQLSTALMAQSKPVQLALDDLLNVAKHLSSKAEQNWPEEFKKNFLLAHKSLQSPLPKMQENEQRIAQLEKEEQYRLVCERVANSISELKDPVTVQFGNNISFKNGIITVSNRISASDVLATCESLMKSYNHKEEKTVGVIDDIKQFDLVDSESKKENTALISESEVNHVIDGGNDAKSSKTIRIMENRKITDNEPFIFGDIEKIHKYNVVRYFPKEPFDDCYYRLDVQETRLNESGELGDYVIGSNCDNLVPVTGWPDDIQWRTTVEEDEIYGKIELTLHEGWQSLPSLTPMDKLRAIRVSPEVEVDVMRNKDTGQLLVRSRVPLSKKVLISFVIAPEQAYFYPLVEDASVVVQNSLCSERLKQLLERKVFDSDDESCDSFNELKDINEVDSIPQRLNLLHDWLDTFSSDKNTTGQGEELFLNMLREKQGVCKHKSMIFQMFCHYWGIPARQIRNVSHQFVEISPDGGNSWCQYQLGGGGIYISDITEQSWNEFEKPLRSDLHLPSIGSNSSSVESSTGEMSNEDPIQSRTAHLLDKFENKILSKEVTNPDTLFSEIKKEILSEINRGEITFKLNLLFTSQFYEYIRHDDEWGEVIDKLLDMDAFDEYLEKHLNVVHILQYARNGIEGKKYLLETERSDQEGSDFEDMSPINSPIRVALTQKDTLIPKQLHHDYIEWLCDLCEKHESLKNEMLGKLQQQVRLVDNYPCNDRILNMVATASVPKSTTLVKEPEPDVNRKFIRSLTKSRLLEFKASKVSIKKKYTRTPTENSEFVPEKIVCDLPAFLSHATSKETKPVIFDLHNLKGMFSKQLSRLLTIYNSEDKISTLMEDLFVKPKNNRSFPKTLMTAFFVWLGEHKSPDSEVWRWFLGGYCICLEQHTPESTPEISFTYPVLYKENALLVTNIPADLLKKHIKTPDAVVLKENDFEIMFDEFIKALLANKN